MEKNRTDTITKESGIALVTALIMTVVVLMLIGSLSYLFTKAFQTNIINRQFSTVYEAANGGAEYAAGIVKKYMDTQSLQWATNIGWYSVSGGIDFLTLANCTSTDKLTKVAIMKARTADGNYEITMTIMCTGTSVPPGEGGVRRFPPPPKTTGGGVGVGTGNTIYFYSIIADATELNGSKNVGHTEALFRLMK
ncbi:MAG: hypothetical protein HY754_15360 [Nitrospirae bacterium]|nr:hypothetical protein [Nitrospirota bacterium]